MLYNISRIFIFQGRGYVVLDALALLLYSQLDLFCICLLGVLFVHSLRNTDLRRYWRYFQYIVLGSICFILLDYLYLLGTNHVIPMSPEAAYVVNAVYFIVGGISLFFWMIYAERITNSTVQLTPLRLLFYLSPLIALCVLMLLSFFTGWVYSLNSTSQFQRGPYYLLAYLLPYSYLIVEAVRLLIRAMQRKNYAHKRELLGIFLYSLPLLCALVLSVFVTASTPLPCLATTISALLLYMNSQDSLVSIDPLTKLNNRTQLLRHLSVEMSRLDDTAPLFLMILDLDHFKRINDQFGHVTGDQALERFANVLHSIQPRFGCFMSRYGGDEFIIVHRSSRPGEMDALCQAISRTLEESNAQSDAPYQLHFSYGWARCTPDLTYIPDFIALADQQLYHMKARRKRCDGQ